ncbi:MAG TPA: hypothetical protein DCY14_13170, partial [Anaerolineae bacterium]|nr:hypothetical protein [Anaerolineae bacterium]
MQFLPKQVDHRWKYSKDRRLRGHQVREILTDPHVQVGEKNAVERTFKILAIKDPLTDQCKLGALIEGRAIGIGINGVIRCIWHEVVRAERLTR